MPVIAMTQEMGSLAKDVAIQLAETAGLAVMRHEVLDHVAGRMHVPGSLISRLREGKAGLVERLTTDEQRLAIYTAQEVFAIASKGDVVLRGWGATCLLRPVRHVVRVRVTRSLSKRVEWLMGHLETDDAAFAEAEVRRSDDAHSLRMHEQFGVTWGDPVLYDLTLNTDRLSVESCVAQILQLTGRPEFQETGASRAMLKDLALNARIRAAFKDYESTRGVNIQIESQGGKVVLSGIVLNTHESTEAARIAATLPGVDSVDNQLRLMTTSRRFTSAKY
ncbi:MAG: transporter [Polaromonas sp. 39-63-203]|jgi:cytidylate kinase|uniref:cytidylate kinase family protein n=1 Tax=Polaromonas sp. TaxID=1869339 RepID=UPI000BD9C7DF|nr:cytidylate kinase family protein [Polaromonas sp.]OYY99773.1 MAG: transporter [Polaromonas sp. 28-63-22]OYZ84854.1 MAG: transporter [Polaromonas sp. 24-62-144]OZB01221.1 MAG: transporter [Polaromonas sp. 39-63-203]HQS32578.1 cytidylate kinase family protein [Polaromonas sp.]HQS91832.1 cytidylate kinase family protein [Polaromonas sp.]